MLKKKKKLVHVNSPQVNDQQLVHTTSTISRNALTLWYYWE